MVKGLKFVAIALVALMVAGPAHAQFRPNRIPNIIRILPNAIKPPLPLLRVKIRPSQAAAIAQGQVANSTVVGVKLLPSGTYAVTLRTDNSVARIMVDGQDGSIN
jgi:hypothetical protein